MSTHFNEKVEIILNLCYYFLIKGVIVMLDLYINIRTSDARFRKPLSFVAISTVTAGFEKKLKKVVKKG